MRNMGSYWWKGGIEYRGYGVKTGGLHGGIRGWTGIVPEAMMERLVEYKGLWGKDWRSTEDNVGRGLTGKVQWGIREMAGGVEEKKERGQKGIMGR